MTYIEILTAVLGSAGTVCAVVFAYLAFKRNNKKDNESEGRNIGNVLAELVYIKSGIDDIKRKQEKQDEQYVGIISRLTGVEASAKQAHHRLDNMEGKHER